MPLPEVDGEPPVVSLGALYYEPMWIFLAASRPPVDKLAELAGSRMAIGAEGSGTRALALQLLRRKRRRREGTTRFLPIGGEEALTALDAGEVDVVFQVAGIEAPIVRDAAAPARPEADEPRARDGATRSATLISPC